VVDNSKSQRTDVTNTDDKTVPKIERGQSRDFFNFGAPFSPRKAMHFRFGTQVGL